MRIGIKANSFENQGYGYYWNECVYKKLREHGYSCSDFNMADTDSFIYIHSQKEVCKKLLHERKLACEAGIEIAQVHGPWRWPVKDGTEYDRKERMEKMKKSIMYTAVLGSKNWVIHPIMPYGISDLNTDNAKRTWDINFEFMSELLNCAKDYDITICLENMPMPEFSIASPEDILRFVNLINDEHFKICLDTGHVEVFGNLVLADKVRKLGNNIRALHVHDNKFGIDMHLMPYFGGINWREFAKSLKDINFNGSFSLETVPPSNLTNDIFENACILLARIADDIVRDI